jgi:4-oxalocrotonate tautomerase
MPIVQISIVEGRDPEAVKACVKEVARAVHRTLGAPLPTIRVLVHQVPKAFWAVGDETRDDIDAAKAAASKPSCS